MFAKVLPLDAGFRLKFKKKNFLFSLLYVKKIGSGWKKNRLPQVQEEIVPCSVFESTLGPAHSNSDLSVLQCRLRLPMKHTVCAGAYILHDLTFQKRGSFRRDSNQMWDTWCSQRKVNLKKIFLYRSQIVRLGRVRIDGSKLMTATVLSRNVREKGKKILFWWW